MNFTQKNSIPASAPVPIALVLAGRKRRRPGPQRRNDAFAGPPVGQPSPTAFRPRQESTDQPARRTLGRWPAPCRCSAVASVGRRAPRAKRNSDNHVAILATTDRVTAERSGAERMQPPKPPRAATLPPPYRHHNRVRPVAAWRGAPRAPGAFIPRRRPERPLSPAAEGVPIRTRGPCRQSVRFSWIYRMPQPGRSSKPRAIKDRPSISAAQARPTPL